MTGEHESTQGGIAAFSMWLWMACVVVFIALAYAQAPAEKKTLLGVLATGVPNAALLAFAVWVSVGVRRGKRLTAAAGLLIFYGVAALVAATILLGPGGSYTGSSLLLAWMIVLFLAWLFSLVAVLRARP